MRRITLQTLSSVSFATLALAATPAYGQASSQPVTPDEAQACTRLPTQAERDACVAAQARPEGTPEEAGDPATMAPGENAERQAETETVVVTGSRIRRSVFSSPDPLTVIDPELEQRAGRNDTAEILQTSPAASGSFQITSLISAGGFVTGGGVGAQTLSLRGLGAERTLVLLNGRRAGPAGTRGQIAGFDLNVIPSAAIQSVEILKTGASSIYGSDAIAGVVNLLTRRSTNGLELRGFSSVPLDSGGENYSVSAVYGREFSRGYIIGGVDYTHRNELERGDRDYLYCPEEYLFNRDGQRVDVNDPRTGRPRCNGSFANSLSISQSAFPGQPNTVVFSTVIFNGPGARLNEFLSPIPSTATFALPAGFFGLPACFANAAPAQADLCRLGTGLADPVSPLIRGVTVSPRLDRYTAFLQGGYNITDGIEITGEFLFNRRETESQGFRQLFFQQFSGQSFAGNNRPSVICPAVLNRPLSSGGPRPNCDATSTGDPLNNGFVGNFLIQPIVGVPSNNATRVDYYRGVGGLKAENLFGLLDGWNFDSYVQYSRSDGDYTTGRIFQDAVETLEYRSRLCAPGQVTRIRGVPCQNIDFTDPRVIAGQFTQQESDYLFGDETGNTIYEQISAEASVSGTLFNLPAGPLGVAFGVQYRRDQIDDTPGQITLSNNVFAQSVSGRTAGHSTSQEAFAEVQVPIFRNQPFFRELTLSLAGRVVNSYSERESDGLSDTDNGNFTYRIGVNWAVNEWLRFRGTYGTSFRSPALFEQFLADQTGFLSQAQIDPCINYANAVANLTLPARVGERCAALGIPGNYNGGGTSSAVISTGGGIGVLDPETSKAFTLGVVLTPPGGPWRGSRFSLAVDYFDIEVVGQVTTLGAGNIVSTCFNADDYPNVPECTLFTREVNTTSPNFPQISAVRNPYLNINSQRNRGVDFTARFNQDLGSWGSFALLGQATWQLEDTFELFRGFISDSEGEVGEPTVVGNLRATYVNGPWSVFYGIDYVSGVSQEQDYRNQAVGGDICAANVIRGGTICPVLNLPAQFYHSMSITHSINERFNITFGVNNIFDTAPPRVSGTGGNISTTGQVPTFGTQYDLVGRRAFVSVRARM